MIGESVEATEQQEISLALLRELRSQVLSISRLEAAAIEDYLANRNGRIVIARSVSVASRERDQSRPDPTDHSTCTSFVVAHLADPCLFGPAVALTVPSIAASAAWSFAGQQTRAVMNTVIADFETEYRLRSGNLEPSSESREGKDVAPLPNAYSTPIHLSGLATALGCLYGQGMGGNKHSTELGLAVAAEVAKWLSANEGLIYHVDPNEPIEGRPPEILPNPYLSYWCMRSLTDWIALTDRLPQEDSEKIGGVVPFQREANASLSLALESALDRLSRMTAAYHSGIGSLFDAVDLVCTVACVGLISRQLRKQDEFIDGLMRHTLALLLEGYVHSDGSFAPKSPALTTRGGYSIAISSAELAAILLHGVGPELEARHILLLERIYLSISRKRGGSRGWGRGAGASPLRRTAFAASGALSFLRSYYAALNHQIAGYCARELGVQPYAPDPQVEAFELPSSVREKLVDRVIKPIQEGQRRDLAVMSFVLGGPPGTAKTTIAKKIARELRWPILVLDQGFFLRKGVAQLESEAERVFDLLLELSETVVLFDEIEEMVEDRGHGEKAGRFLTTSMLPRIHRLRDRGLVIFIIATNHPERIDAAASRPGRIDTIFEVAPPTMDERQDILKRLLERYNGSDQLRESFKELGVVGQTDKFTFGYLKELVRSCVGHEQAHGSISNEELTRELNAMKDRASLEQVGEGTRKR